MNHRMRILLLHSSLDIGGTEQYMLTLVRRLVQGGCSVDVAAFPGRYSPAFRDAGADVLPLQFDKGNGYPAALRGYRSSMKRLSLAAPERRWEVINVQSRYVYPAGFRIARKMDIPIVFTAHNVFRSGRLLPYGADAYIAVSGPVRDALRRHPFVRKDAIHVIHPPVEPSRERDEPQGDGSERRRPIVVFAGRFVFEKGIDVLIESIPDVVARVPGAIWKLYGEGPLRARAAAMIERMGLTKSVIMSDWISDRERIFAEADIVVLPAVSREGFGLAIAEAMQRFVPVVATPVGGIPDLVIDGRTGLLVPPGDARSLAAAVTTLLREPETCRVLAENAREHVRRLCDPGGRSMDVLEILAAAIRSQSFTRRS